MLDMTAFRTIGGGRTRSAFTLTEILVAIAIVGIISALVLPIIISNYTNSALEHAYNKEVKSITEMINNLPYVENKSFFETEMYSTTYSDDYYETSGKFLKKYFKISKYCGNSNGDCFAPMYYEYKDNDMVVYKPEFKGACASLKNGMSLCLTNQVGGASITGIIDLNGKRGPNVYGRDLKTFSISPLTRTTKDKTAGGVYHDTTLIKLKGNACDENSLSLECCQSKTIEENDPCCTLEEISTEYPDKCSTGGCTATTATEECCSPRYSEITSPSDPCCTLFKTKLNVEYCFDPHVDVELLEDNGTKYIRAKAIDFPYNLVVKAEVYFYYNDPDLKASLASSNTTIPGGIDSLVETPGPNHYYGVGLTHGEEEQVDYPNEYIGTISDENRIKGNPYKIELYVTYRESSGGTYSWAIEDGDTKLWSVIVYPNITAKYTNIPIPRSKDL